MLLRAEISIHLYVLFQLKILQGIFLCTVKYSTKIKAKNSASRRSVKHSALCDKREKDETFSGLYSQNWKVSSRVGPIHCSFLLVF